MRKCGWLSRPLDQTVISTLGRGSTADPLQVQRRSIAPSSRCSRASGRGLIVNLGSVAGIRGGGSNIAYAAAKAGVHAMTMSLARALAPEIRVVAVAPSLMETPMTQMW